MGFPKWLDAIRSISRETGWRFFSASRPREQPTAMPLNPSLDRVAGGRVSFAGSGEERPPSVVRAAGWNG